MTLDQLSVGQRAEVLALGGDDLFVQRLSELGMFEGCMIEFLRRAPLGDPVEIRIDGRFNLSLRKADARFIEVAPH